MISRITLAGDIGSGKTQVSRILQDLTGFDVISTGAIQRQIAAAYGMTPLELNQYSQTNREIDDKIDGYLKELNYSGNKIIIDSRMAWHFVTSSFKVYLTVNPEVAAHRVIAANRTEEKHASLAEALANNLQRKTLENERFKNLYGVDCEDPNNYDLVIDTSNDSPEAIAEHIVNAFQDWQKVNN